MSNYAIYFSPTYSTEKVTKILATEFGSYDIIDLGERDEQDNYEFKKDDLCIIAVPSYGGRVPEIALKRMEHYKGNQAKAVLVVVYGNRDYDDTFAELQDFVEERGFCPVAAIAAVAEHSVMHQFAKGRPDADDEAKLVEFAGKIKEALSENREWISLDLPGNRPYKEYNGIPLKPKAGSNCTKCRVCSKACPVGAIPFDAPNLTNKDVCISCMRCIEVCPVHARKVNGLMLKVASMKMKKACADRKENELFMNA